MRASLNPTLEIHGVVLTMHDSRTKLADEVSNEVRNFFGEKVYSTVIPRNVRVAEAPSHGKPILLYDYKSPGSRAYIELAAEIIDRERKATAALDHALFALSWERAGTNAAFSALSSPRRRGSDPAYVRPASLREQLAGFPPIYAGMTEICI